MAYDRPYKTTQNPNWQNAEDPVDLIPYCDDPHGKGVEMLQYIGAFLLTQGPQAGKRFIDCMLPWQKALFLYVFGNTDHNENRIVNRLFLKIGKGVGKSTAISAMVLGMVMWSAANGKNQRGLAAIIAPGISTANIIFTHILQAVLNDPHLDGQFVTSSRDRSITHVESGIEIQIMVPSISGSVGRRPFIIALDEEFAASEIKDFSIILDQLRKGGQNWGADFLMASITTAPMHRAVGNYAVSLQDAHRIRDGDVVNDKFLPICFEYPVNREDLDIEDSSEWWRGLPSLGATLPTESIIEEYETAKNSASSEPLALFLSQRLGIEPEDRRAVDGLLLQDKWLDLPRAGNVPADTPLWIAFDPSSGADDPSAMIVLWQSDGKVCITGEQHLTEIGYDRASQHTRDLYDKAVKAGELVIHPTAEVMDSKIIEKAKELHKQANQYCVLGGDKFGRAGFPTRIKNELDTEYHAVAQGWQLQAALSDAEAMAGDLILAHNNQPLLNANIMNLTVEDSGQGRRFSKAGAGLSGQGEAKIDGAMAALSAISLLAAHPQNYEADISYWVG
jgi:phage terminase large subunit-like protein